MRALLVFVVIVGLGYFFLRQKQAETPPVTTKPATIRTAIVKPAAAPLTPAPRGQASEYNYMKRALDRAADVRDQSRAQTKEAQDP
jgi:hypothetical protein